MTSIDLTLYSGMLFILIVLNTKEKAEKSPKKRNARHVNACEVGLLNQNYPDTTGIDLRLQSDSRHASQLEKT